MRAGRPVLLCGIVLLLTLVAVSRIDARASSGALVALVAVASLTYGASLAFVARGRVGSRRMLLACVMLSVLWRGALMVSAPLVSDDVYRYVWDGRVQRLGYNPYESAPDDPSLAHAQTEVTRRIHPVSAALPTIYPPAAELFFRVVTTAHESVLAMVVAVVLCDLITIYVLWRWSLSVGGSPWWILAYAWHPLVALEGAGGGHIDLVGTLLVAAAAYALSVRRTLLASAALALAFAVKFLPMVLVPLLWRRVRLRDALLGVGLVALVYLPFVTGGTGMTLPVGSLGTYAEHWRFNGPLFPYFERWLGVSGGLALGAVAGLVVASVARARLAVDDPRAWAWPLAATVVLMPAIYPWYLVWVTPFLSMRATWPLTTWTLASMLTYTVWANETAGVGWVLPAWVMPVEYGLVAATILAVWWYPGSSREQDAS